MYSSTLLWFAKVLWKFVAVHLMKSPKSLLVWLDTVHSLQLDNLLLKNFCYVFMRCSLCWNKMFKVLRLLSILNAATILLWGNLTIFKLKQNIYGSLLAFNLHCNMRVVRFIVSWPRRCCFMQAGVILLMNSQRSKSLKHKRLKVHTISLRKRLVTNFEVFFRTLLLKAC